MSWQILKVDFSPDAQRDLRALDQGLRVRILKGVNRYAETGAGHIKRLQGLPDFRLRVGDYRIRFIVEGNEVLIMLILRVGHRREVYR